MSKLTALLLLSFFASVLRQNFAAVVKDVDFDDLTASVQKGLRHLFSNQESADHNRTNAYKWMSHALNQVDGEPMEHMLITKIAVVNDIALTTELVSLADGFHLIVPSGEILSETVQRIEAIAITDMLMNLKTMVRMDTILANCSLRSTLDVLSNKNDNEYVAVNTEKFFDKGREYMGKLFTHWLQSVTKVLENDSHLCEEFANCKEEARRAVIFSGTLHDGVQQFYPTSETLLPTQVDDASIVEKKLAEKMFSSRLFRKMTLNKMFLRVAFEQMSSLKTNDEKGQALLARTLLDLAAHKGQDSVKVNELYGKTLSRVADLITGTDEMEAMCDRLFEKLEMEMEEDIELSKRVQSLENRLNIWLAFRAMRRSVAFI